MLDPRDSPAIFALVVLGIDQYDWQVEACERIAMRDRVTLRAANGSGKTANVIAIMVLWFLWRHPKGRCAIISGSWKQVEKQLFPALTKWRGHPAFAGWKWNHCNIITPQGGEAIGFSTDNAGRAEGWHESPDSPMFYIVDEAKTVPDSIFEAIDRCSLTYLLYASSPGNPRGRFYRSHYSEAHLYYPIKATAYQCAHIKRERIALVEATYPADHPVRRSMLDAEFTDADGDLFLSQSDLRESINMYKTPFARCVPRASAFCDFAAGRDENVIGITHEGYAWVDDHWRDTNTIQASRRFVRRLQHQGVKPSNVWGDADGLGIGMIQQMAESGYRIKSFRGGIPSSMPDRYTNLIAQVWYEGCQKIRSGEIVLKDCSSTLYDQLTSRKLEYDSKNRIRAMSKENMRAEGIKSPDQADAVLGSIWAAIPTGVYFGDKKDTDLSIPKTSYQVETVEIDIV